ncbi:hypothetical protein [Loktanella fryxellensis]|nr:hypothetical protein [Loktanella fryxellensis]
MAAAVTFAAAGTVKADLDVEHLNAIDDVVAKWARTVAVPF